MKLLRTDEMDENNRVFQEGIDEIYLRDYTTGDLPKHSWEGWLPVEERVEVNHTEPEVRK